MAKLDILESLGYKVEEEIAKGTDGVVKKVRDHNQVIYAVKVVKLKSKLAKKRFRREAMNMMIVGSHQNVVTVKSFHERDGEGVIVMKYHATPNLMTYFLQSEPLNENEVRTIFRGMCHAVQQCHIKNIAHLDIKPDNFLIEPKSKKVYLCDFFRSYQWTDPRLPLEDLEEIKNSTTIFYRSPESFHADIETDLAKADVWALGVCLFGLLFGFFPFDVQRRRKGEEEGEDGGREKMEECGEEMIEVLNFNFEKFHVLLTNNAKISERAKSLLRCMLHPVPEERFTIFEVLSHPFCSSLSAIMALSLDQM